jgi:caveolin 1
MAEKVELAEQIPLKTDTDANEPIVAEGGDVEVGQVIPEKSTAEKKKIFFWKKNKQGEVVSEKVTTEVKETAENGKKKCWWNCQKAEKAEKDQPTFGMDMINRDEKSLHTAIDLEFSDIFGEPEALHSFQPFWRWTNTIFNGVRNFFYKLITVIFALPLAIVFGILFAIVSALNVFVCVPVGRLLTIPAGWIFKTWNFVISNVFDPITRSLGLLFANISMRRYGINNEVTQPLSA